MPAQPPGTWPHTITGDGGTATVYQPQVISWPEHRTLNTRIAIGITPTGAKAPILGVDRGRVRHADRARRAHRRPHRTASSCRRAFRRLDTGAGRAIRGAHQGRARQSWAPSACRSPRSCMSLRAAGGEAARGRARQHAAAHLRQRAAGEPRRVRRRAGAGADRRHVAVVRREHQLGRVLRLERRRPGTCSTTAAGSRRPTRRVRGCPPATLPPSFAALPDDAQFRRREEADSRPRRSPRKTRRRSSSRPRRRRSS